MIIARSPLRITLGGGGTDLPSYYQEYEGYVLSAAIDKYIYTSVIKPFNKGIYLKYSSQEKVASVEEIQHPIIKEALKLFNIEKHQIEITTLADIPSGTGLGSSGSFTTSLLKALYAHFRLNISPEEIAELACQIEIEKMNEPVGKQDQYIAAIGGITEFSFKKDGEVKSSTLQLSDYVIHELEDKLLLFFTGISRSASSILRDQATRSSQLEKTMLDNLHFTKNLGRQTRDTLIGEDLRSFAELMNVHWNYKKQRSPGMSNDHIDEAYALGLKNGALGGKLVGAGGGGFLMFYADNTKKLRSAMEKLNYQEIRFKFDFEGTKVILQ